MKLFAFSIDFMLASFGRMVLKIDKLQFRNVGIFWFPFQNYDSHSCRDIMLTKGERSGWFGPGRIVRNFNHICIMKKLLSLRSLVVNAFGKWIRFFLGMLQSIKKRSAIMSGIVRGMNPKHKFQTCDEIKMITWVPKHRRQSWACPCVRNPLKRSNGNGQLTVSKYSFYENDTPDS